MKKKTIGIYTGSFNPFHIGHLDVLNKAKKIFDEVIVAVGVNPDKYAPHEIDGRVKKIREQLPDERVESFFGFITDFMKSLQTKDTELVLVRGLRNGYDLDYEIQQMRYMEDIYPEINVVMIPCGREVGHISSSMIKVIGKFDISKTSKYLP